MKQETITIDFSFQCMGMYRNVFGFSIYGNEKSIVMVYCYGHGLLLH